MPVPSYEQLLFYVDSIDPKVDDCTQKLHNARSMLQMLPDLKAAERQDLEVKISSVALKVLREKRSS